MEQDPAFSYKYNFPPPLEWVVKVVFYFFATILVVISLFTIFNSDGYTISGFFFLQGSSFQLFF